MQFSIEINGVTTTARSGETIMNVLSRNGIKVPTLCNMPGFSPTGSCRMCVVEVEGLDGLVPACSHPVQEWMQIRTHSPAVISARKTIAELLLANHPDDCLYCDRSGNCELQRIAGELNIRERKYNPRKPSILTDRNCPSIERNPAKCILCERCIRVCDEVIGACAIEIIGRGSNSMIGTSYNNGLNVQACVKCGQCITVCPTSAIKEKTQYQKVITVLNDPAIYPVIHLSASVIVAVGEEFGIKPGKDLSDRITIALQKTGFREVHDTSAAADIYALEMTELLAEKIRNKDKTPILTSNCPSFVHYILNSKPEFTEYLAPLKSVNAISGGIIKKYYPRENTKEIYSVGVTPCTSAKAESDGDNDVTLTSRELIRILRHFGIDLTGIESPVTEPVSGYRGSSGKLFEIAGGTTESIVRSLYNKLTGQELNPLKINELRGFKGKKEYRIKIGKTTLTLIAVNGLGNVRPVLDEISAGRNDILMIEVMACPGGCINGGGQRFSTEEKVVRNRSKALYDSDDEEMIKVAHKNQGILKIFSEFLRTDGVIVKPGLLFRGKETTL